MKKVNIKDELAAVTEHWSQRVIGEANGQLFKVAKGIGEINWHKHDDQDELFILYKGHLTIQLRSENIELFEGEMFVVPKGVEHCPRAEEEVEFLIVGLDITSNEKGGKPVMSAYLVRHAHAHWQTSEERPLSEEGRAGARALADCLGPTTIFAIHSSPARRAIETIEPLAEARGLRS